MLWSLSAAFAAPAVVAVDGALEDGGQLVLSGTAFGSGPEVIVFDDFEVGAAGEAVPVGSSSAATVGAWDRYGYGACSVDILSEQPQFASDEVRSGSHSMVMNGEDDCIGSGLTVDLNDSELFFHQWVYVPSDACVPGPPEASCGGSNWKTNWLLGPGDSTVNGDRYPIVTDGGANNRVGSNCSTDSHYLSSFTFRTGEWMLWTYWTDVQSDGVGDHEFAGYDGGRHQIWSTITGGDMQSSCSAWTGEYSSLAMGGYTSGGNAGLYPLYDDVYVSRGSNARARVVLADADTLSNSSVHTLCTTGTSVDTWSDSSIACTVREGVFRDGDPTWAIVIDGDGQHSAGIDIGTWGSVAGDTAAIDSGDTGSSGSCIAGLVGPAEATDITTTPTFEWTGDCDGYLLELSGDATFSGAKSFLFGATSRTNHSPTNQWTNISDKFAEGGWWRVIGGTADTAYESEARSFTVSTATSTLPDPSTKGCSVTLEQPVDGASVASDLSPRFQWSTGCDRVWLELSDDAAFPVQDTLFFGSTSRTGMTVSSTIWSSVATKFASGGVWRVVGVGADGQHASSTSAFTLSMDTGSGVAGSTAKGPAVSGGTDSPSSGCSVTGSSSPSWAAWACAALLARRRTRS